MYDWLLFDLDGTLTDPKEGITKCIQYALHDQGVFSEELDALSRYIGPPLMESFSNYFDEEGCKRAVKKYRERYEIYGMKECRLYDGIKDVLAAAKASGKMLAMATSKPQAYAEQILRNYGIDVYIDLPVGAITDSSTKADVINLVLEKAGIADNPKAHALMIGDRKYDIEGANLCGIDSLGVYYGFAEPGELEKEGAKYIVNTVEELKEFVEKKDISKLEKWIVK